MSDDFLTSEQTENYGRYVADPNEVQLALLQIVGGDKLIIPFC